MNPGYDFGMTQKELCEICAPILMGRMKDIIRSKCQVPTCLMFSASKLPEWLPITVICENGKKLSASLAVDYGEGSTSMTIRTNKIRW